MKKNNTIKYIIFVVGFVLIVTGGILYMSSDKEKNISNTEEDVIDDSGTIKGNGNINRNDKTVQKLFNTFRMDGERCNYVMVDSLNNNNQTKLAITYGQIPKEKIKKISCVDVKTFEGKDLINACPDQNTPIDIEYVDANDLKEEFYKLFSKVFKYNNETFYSIDKQMIYYDENREIYAKFPQYITGSCINYTKQEIISVNKEMDYLYIETQAHETTYDEDRKIKYEFLKENDNFVFLNVTEE